jgi:uncharacterized membrane-anchored protein YjiN (DUF445 family)
VPAAPTFGTSLSRSEQVRQRQLVAGKRRASGLLAAVTVLFLVVSIWGGDASWVGYVEATALASMAGGLADWFAVTALFRRPLGLPIPHTAIVVERKDQFAATLGEFVQERFLTPEVVVERVKTAEVVPRLAAWLSDPANASRVAAEVANAIVAVADGLRDDEVNRTLEEMLRARVETEPLAPLAGRVLRFLTQEGRHYPVLDAALRGLDRYLGEHRAELRARLGRESPWWLPGAVEDRIFERLLDAARAVVREMAGDHEHHLRRDFETRLVVLAKDLETSPELLARGEQLKAELLDQPEVWEWVASLWQDVKERLRAQAADPSSELHRRLALAVAGAGRRLQEDAALAARLEHGLESGVRYVAENFQGEIATLVTTTVARWDASETAYRLELLLGPDLQYVRLNGTLVGAVVGLLLHVLTQALG